MDECEGKPRPDVILMDFEKGMNEAFRTTFSDSLIRGCAFHWLQLLRRRMGEDGLIALYNNDAKFQLVIHQVINDNLIFNYYFFNYILIYFTDLGPDVREDGGHCPGLGERRPP